ncbi:MAG: hypothetical protein IPJ78_13420 [Gemmatimonadetes bacterium]|nr:hypothetical protein [Gemmatimonadota bacterium]
MTDSTLAIVDLMMPSRRMAFRSPSYTTNTESNRFIIFHEGLHAATGWGDDVLMPNGMTVANYYGRMCSRGYL